MIISIYERIGHDNLRKLVHDFYSGIKQDELLSPMYDNDFSGAEERLFLFLMQYFGGPEIYNQQRGHPRLRMRHAIFPITEKAKQNWLFNMKRALEISAIHENEKQILWNYFEQTAEFLKNQ